MEPDYVCPHSAADAELLAHILTAVDASVAAFRPSPSLADVGSADAAAAPATEIDLVCSGGGLKGYFMVGAREVLERQLKRRNMVVRRYAGASAGAWCAVFMASGLSSTDWLRTYTSTAAAMRAESTGHIHAAYREHVWPWLKNALPADAYERCSGRCFLSITVFDPLPRNLIVSSFTSNDDLFEAALASSLIPLVTSPGLGATFRGMRVCDGGLLNNCPTFADGARRQLVVDLGEVRYPMAALVSPCDPCIEALVLSGALQMARFLEGRPCSRAIQWVDAAAASRLRGGADPTARAAAAAAAAATALLVFGSAARGRRTARLLRALILVALVLVYVDRGRARRLYDAIRERRLQS